MPTPIRIEGVLIEIEATYRTDPIPTGAANTVRLSDRFFSAMSLEYQYPNIRDGAVTGTLLPVLPGRPEGRIVTGVIALELAGSGAAYSSSVLPQADALWRASGYSQTIVTTSGLETVSYAPADSSHESFTMYAYGAGNEYRVVGCRCNPIWPISAGELGMLRFEFQGFLDSAPTAVALPAQTFSAQVPQPAVTTAITVGSVVLDAPASLEFNGGVELVRIPDANDASGVSEIFIVRHRPTAQIRMLTEAIGTYDPYADWNTPTLRTIDALVGSVQYNQANLDMNNAYIESLAHADQDGLTAWDVGYFSTDLAILYD